MAVALLPACASITAVRPWSGLGELGPTGLLERTALWVDGVVVAPGAEIEPETLEPLADAFRSFLRTNGGWGKVLATRDEVDAYAAAQPAIRPVGPCRRSRACCLR